MTLDPKTLELLSAYLDGAAAPADKAAVEELLAGDAEARKFVAEALALRGDLKKLPTLTPPEAFYARVMRDIDEAEAPARRTRRFFSPLRAVSALLVAVVVGVTTRDLWKDREKALRQPPSPIQMLQSRVQARQEQETAELRENVDKEKVYFAAKQKAVPAAEGLRSHDAGAERDDLPMKGAIGIGGALSNAAPAAATPAAAAPPAAPAPAREAPQAEENVRNEFHAEPRAQTRRKAFLKDVAPAEGETAALDSLKKSADAAERGLPFQSEDRGEASGVARFETDAVRTPQAWKTLWARHAPGTPAPSLDFSRVTVLALFAGEKPTAGHDVRILRVERKGAGLRVFYRAAPPPAGAFVSQVLTRPFHWVAVPRADGPIEFIPQ